MGGHALQAPGQSLFVQRKPLVLQSAAILTVNAAHFKHQAPSTGLVRSRRLAVFLPLQGRTHHGKCRHHLHPGPGRRVDFLDVAEYNGVLVTTQIPTHADGSLELGDIVEQSECTLQALKVALEKPAAAWTACCT
jgi:hypothetical protein